MDNEKKVKKGVSKPIGVLIMLGYTALVGVGVSELSNKYESSNGVKITVNHEEGKEDVSMIIKGEGGSKINGLKYKMKKGNLLIHAESNKYFGDREQVYKIKSKDYKGIKTIKYKNRDGELQELWVAKK